MLPRVLPEIGVLWGVLPRVLPKIGSTPGATPILGSTLGSTPQSTPISGSSLGSTSQHFQGFPTLAPLWLADGIARKASSQGHLELNVPRPSKTLHRRIRSNPLCLKKFNLEGFVVCNAITYKTSGGILAWHHYMKFV